MLAFLFIGTKSRIIHVQHPQKGEFTNSRICSIFENNQIEGKKRVRMKKFKHEFARKYSKTPFETVTVINHIKLTCFFVLSDLRIRGFRTGNFD